MSMRTTTGIAAAIIASVGGAIPTARGDGCPLDHYVLGQEHRKLFVDKQQIYRHGDPTEGYYPMTWSPVYGCWSFGEPGFAMTEDQEYALKGAPNVDYQIWFEILDLSPDLAIRTSDGQWITEVGQRYNLSDWPAHHVHMTYRAYIPQEPPPDYPFYVTYRLVDELGPYGSSEPFICVFMVPAAAVQATTPPYRSLLRRTTDARVTFTFHRAITVTDGPPVVITDEETHTQDYYTGYFDYSVSADGMTLILNQIDGTLPAKMWLEISLTECVRDAGHPEQAVVPFTQYVYTAVPELSGLGPSPVTPSDVARLPAP
jgi:hypothetical protein